MFIVAQARTRDVLAVRIVNKTVATRRRKAKSGYRYATFRLEAKQMKRCLCKGQCGSRHGIGTCKAECIDAIIEQHEGLCPACYRGIKRSEKKRIKAGKRVDQSLRKADNFDNCPLLNRRGIT